LCGDIDGDGQVTGKDVLAEALARFGSVDLRDDLNGDARVNAADVVLVAKQLGRSCSPTTDNLRGRSIKRFPLPEM
jgi:hypothetical protein